MKRTLPNAMTIADVSSQKVALEFKSVSLTVPVLLLSSGDLSQIEQQLKEKVAQAPEFFKHSPLLIDLQKLNALNQNLVVNDLVDCLRQQGFLPIGIRGGTEKQNQQALALGLPVHSLHSTNPVPAEKNASKVVVAVAEKVSEPGEAVTVENKLITQPVRSGQRVYAKGDLIVTATVSAGAEIMAEGNIHVYGSLRGRALAGVLGNVDSRIFCSDLQAELISIAGIYQLSDDIAKHELHRPMQICLDNQTLVIKDI